MTKYSKLLMLAFALATATWGLTAAAQTDMGQMKNDTMHQHDAMSGKAKAWHGGAMMTVGDRSFETVATPDGVCVYAYAANGAPMRLDKAAGSVTVRFADGTVRKAALEPKDAVQGEPTAYFCPMHPDATQFEPGTCAQCGGMKLMPQDAMFGAMNMSDATGGMRAEVALSHVPGEKADVTYTAMVPMHGMGDMPTSNPMGSPPKQPQPDSKSMLGNHRDGGK